MKRSHWSLLIGIVSLIILAVSVIVSKRSSTPASPLSPLALSPLAPLDDKLYIPSVSSEWRLGKNLPFEDGSWSVARYWIWPWHEAYTAPYDEIRPAAHWTAWWVERRFCPGYEFYKSGRPEVQVVNKIPDPLRVYEGNQALKFFTFWRCQIGGIYQVVKVTPGRYRFGVHFHHWYSNCSERPHDPPYQEDCTTPIADPAVLTLGIDPTGAEDYWSTRIVWTDSHSQYGMYSDDPFWSREVLANGDSITLWIRSETTAPLKHSDLYIDNVIIEKVMQ